MTKRTHKDTTRLTAKERAQLVTHRYMFMVASGVCVALTKDIERHLQLHARETLERFKRRRGL